MEERVRVRLVDVALRAGVSPKTASVALQHGGGSAETVAGVVAAANELGYRPRRRRGAGPRVLVLTPLDLNPTYFIALRNSVRDTLRMVGYEAVFFDVGDSLPTEMDVVDGAIRGGVAGAILVSVRFGRAATERLVRAGVRTVAVTCRPSDVLEGVSRVDVDNFSGLAEVAGNLRRNHEVIGYLHGRIIAYSEHQRFQGFLGAWSGTGEVFDRRYEVQLQHDGRPRFAAGYDGCIRLMRVRPPPTAIVAYNDQMAMGCLLAAHEIEIAVPSQLAIVGHDDLEFARYTVPPLSTVNVDSREVGRVASDELVRLMAGGAPGEPVVVQTQVVERESAPHVRSII
jgi:DNA-binding LacI/PurR family transcriptional regulator